MTANERTDNGSNQLNVSQKFAEQAVLNGIGKMKTIEKIRLQVALKEEENGQTLTFSRAWTLQRTILTLIAGTLALKNFTLLVGDASMAGKELVIGLSVL